MSAITCDGECACEENFLVDSAGENCIPCHGPFSTLIDDECVCDDESSIKDLFDSSLCRCNLENFFYPYENSCVLCSGVGANFTGIDGCICAENSENIEGVCTCLDGFQDNGRHECVNVDVLEITAQFDVFQTTILSLIQNLDLTDAQFIEIYTALSEIDFTVVDFETFSISEALNIVDFFSEQEIKSLTTVVSFMTESFADVEIDASIFIDYFVDIDWSVEFSVTDFTSLTSFVGKSTDIDISVANRAIVRLGEILFNYQI